MNEKNTLLPQTKKRTQQKSNGMVIDVHDPDCQSFLHIYNVDNDYEKEYNLRKNRVKLTSKASLRQSRLLRLRSHFVNKTSRLTRSSTHVIMNGKQIDKKYSRQEVDEVFMDQNNIDRFNGSDSKPSSRLSHTISLSCHEQTSSPNKSSESDNAIIRSGDNLLPVPVTYSIRDEDKSHNASCKDLPSTRSSSKNLKKAVSPNFRGDKER